MAILILFSFLAGVVTILSPCILPILPIILTSTISGERVGYSRPLGVVTGFVLSFTFFTLFLSTIVKLSGIPANSLRLLSVVIIFSFGLVLLVPKFQFVIERLFARLSRFAPKAQAKAGFFPGLVLGFSLGLLWTPCVGPILASVISLAITGTVTLHAILITLAYSAGTAIPMFLIILGGQNALQKVPWLTRNTGNIQRFFGFIMILTAIGIYFNVDRDFQTYILNKFPGYGAGLTQLEDNEKVREQLRIVGQDEDTSDANLSPRGAQAPEIITGGQWFNLPAQADGEPLKLENLRGKVVLIDFWTYSCINCQRTLPYLKDWWEKYKDQGLVIIGVHAPEFEFEKDPQNVSQAIADFDLIYPIVQDNDFATWRAYGNRYWPAKYFIDKDGYVRFTHFGEGAYDESERVIQELLAEAGATDISEQVNNPGYDVEAKTPETYLGYGRLASLASPEEVALDEFTTYSKPSSLLPNTFALSGDWLISQEYIASTEGAELFLDFEAKSVYLVMRSGTTEPTQIRVYLDGVEQQTITVNADTLYELINLDKPERHELKLEFLDENTQAFAFTFG